MSTHGYSIQVRNFAAALILLGLVLVIYSNTYRASWHLDDYSGIIDNQKLHLKSLSTKSICRTFYANPEPEKANRLYRPVSNFTFALNWYLGQERVFGYHIVNSAIHFICAFTLFLTIQALLRSPNPILTKEPDRFAVALLASALWAASPIQIQAVTYIIQRMAALATLFYILSIYLYLNGRYAKKRPAQAVFFIGCFIAAVLALGSKENAITLPLALLLVEAIFFQDLKQPETLKKAVYVGIGAAAIYLLLALLYFKGNPFSVIPGTNSYRPFTIGERVLSSPRILLFYLSLVFCPLPGRFSITHEFALSQSLLEPWTTLPALVLVLMLIVLAFYGARRTPLVAFAILFFFLGHLVESTVIALEPVFEHRNYLPSMFLFMPVASGINRLVHRYGKTAAGRFAGVALCVSMVLGLGLATYIRNSAWATEKTLWEDALLKAPGLARPYQSLAWGHYEKTGQLDKALELYLLSLGKAGQTIRHKARTYNYIGVLYYKKGDYPNAVRYLEMAVNENPGYRMAYFNLVGTLVHAGYRQRVAEEIDIYLSKWPDDAQALYMKGLVILQDGKPEEALSFFEYSLEHDKGGYPVLLNSGVALAMLGRYIEGAKYLEKARSLLPDDPLVYLCLADNRMKSGDSAGVHNYLNRFLEKIPTAKAQVYLDDLLRNGFTPPLSFDRLLPLLEEKIKQSS